MSRKEENVAQINALFVKMDVSLSGTWRWVGILSWIMPKQFDARSENAMN
jgi:hypothetical protein